jgi:hypothetical protein
MPLEARERADYAAAAAPLASPPAADVARSSDAETTA